MRKDQLSTMFARYDGAPELYRVGLGSIPREEEEEAEGETGPL